MMRTTSIMLLSALAVVLLAGVVIAEPIIISDLVSGNRFTLPSGFPGTLYDAQFETTQYTYQNFSNNPTQLNPNKAPMGTPYILINVTWAGDFSDTFNMNLPQGLTVVPVASLGSLPNNCNVSSQTTLNNTNRICVYNLSWSAPFEGTFAIVYANSSFPQGSETVTLTFTNNPPPASSTGRGVGDPQFVGLRGQSYQVHGVDGQVYNLITEEKTQVNSRFVFLTEGQCPIIDGYAADGCWSHPGSYMGDMSFQAVIDGKLHAALVTAGDAKSGLAEVQVDGKALKMGDKVSFGVFSVKYISSHSAFITMENFNIELANSDMFLNLALTAKVSLNRLKSHGLIGQTHSSKVYKTAVKYIEGEVDDYMIDDNDSFGTKFPFNKFQL